MLKEEVNRLRLLQDSSVASDNISLETPGAEAEDREYPAMLVTKQCQVKNCYCDSEKYASTHEEMLKKLKSFEAVLRGSLRREQIAEDREKYLKVEIEHLNRLVRQREDEAQCGKMMLRFREDKIRRLECLTDGLISADKCLAEERNALTEELHLVSTRIDRNPEVTRFAMENIRLMEQLRRFQDFYEEGERDMMFEEISILRNQFQELLTESYLKDEEKIMMASQIDNYRKDLEKCHRNLNAYMEENANYSRQIMELEMKISLLEVNQNHQHHELEFLKDEAFEPVLQVPSGKCTLEKELHENFCLSCMQSESKVSHFKELQTRHDSEIRQLQAQLERVENTFREEETICRHLEKRNFQLSMQLEESKSGVKENMTADVDKLSSLYEFDALLKQYRQVFSCVSSSEEREQILKDHIQQIKWKLPEHDFHRAERDINSSNADEEGKGLTDITKMAVFETIKKTSIVELEETGTLNISDEKEKYSALAVDATIDTLMPGVVTKIADAPTAMLLELSAVTGEYDALDELQQKSQGQVAFLLKELGDLKIKCTELSDENKNLTILYERLLHQKDAETKQLCKEWEDSLTAKLINFLSEGDQALNAAAKEIEEMIEESYSDSRAYTRDKEISFRIANKQIAVELLQLKLEEAYSSSKNMEKEMRAFMSNLKNEGETVSEVTLYNLQPMQQLTDKSLKVLPEVLRKHSELPAADERLIESKAETSRSIRKEITDEELAKGGGQQNNLRFKLKDAHVSCAQEGRAVRDLEFDLKRCEELIQEREEQMYQEKCDWKKEKDQLLLELSKAKLEAAEKTSEAAMVLRRFEACQNTLSEAEFLLNALVKANESAKSEAKCWKDAFCSLTQKQTEPLKDLLDPLDYGSITSEQGKEKAIQSMETSLLQDPKMQHRCLEETNLIVDHPCIMEPDDKEVSATSKQVDGVLIDTLADMIHDVLSAVNEMCEQINLMFSEMSFTKIGIESTLQNLANSWLLLKEDMELKQENESSKTLLEDLEHQRQKIEDLEADTSAYCQQACSAESKLVQMEELLAQMNRVEEENCRKDELVECLELDLALIQECTAEWKEEAQQAKATIKFLQQEVDAKAKDMTKMEMKVVDAEVEHEKICTAFQGMMEELQLLREKASVVSNECEDNTEMLELKQKCHCLEEELANKHHAVETLAAELLEVTSHSEMKMALCLESSKQQVDAISKDRDHLKKELMFLGEKLEVSRQLLYEHEIVAAEAHQAADASKRRAEEKESEINLLQGIVLELKRTLHSLEGQVSILKRETEMQHLLREDRELEIQALKHRMSKAIPVVDWNTDDCNRQIAQIDNKEKTPNEMDMHLMELQDQIELLHTELTDKDEQIKNCKSYIIELVAAAELQADEHQKQIKALNYIVEQIKVDQVRATSFSSTLSRGAERLAAKTRRSSSPFKCVKLGISQQITYETEKELFVNRLQIGELQQVALARDKEIFTLKARLAEAESMTHDVLRDLLCVKMDITSYASSLSQQTLQRYAENSHSEINNAEEKAEICRLRTELDELITERESWLEDINCKQRELKAAVIAAEKLQLRDQRLTKDYERLKDEYDRQKKLVSDLGKTRVLLGNVKDTLAYSGIDAEEALDPEFDYEQLRSTVHKTSQEIESDHLQLAQNLSSLCKSIMQVAGISSGRDPEPSTAMEVLQQLSNRLQSTEQELEYIRLKGRIEGEKKRLSELRGMKSSLKLTGITPIETEATV
ncbi:hypothetical protein O6H91_02G113500 [Diphasiastrum complanatum]|nr:hypothetical protein O6H91_02G113500 [Diphasiastrum complanatum]